MASLSEVDSPVRSVVSTPLSVTQKSTSGSPLSGSISKAAKGAVNDRCFRRRDPFPLPEPPTSSDVGDCSRKRLATLSSSSGVRLITSRPARRLLGVYSAGRTSTERGSIFGKRVGDIPGTAGGGPLRAAAARIASRSIVERLAAGSDAVSEETITGAVVLATGAEAAAVARVKGGELVMVGQPSLDERRSLVELPVMEREVMTRDFAEGDLAEGFLRMAESFPSGEDAEDGEPSGAGCGTTKSVAARPRCGMSTVRLR